MSNAEDCGCRECLAAVDEPKLTSNVPYREAYQRGAESQTTRIGELESKLKEASEFIQKLGPTIDYDIVAEIEEMLK